jgi:hypothetical protein
MAAFGCQPTEGDSVARLMESLASEYDALIAALYVLIQMPSLEIS